jgi:two-component system phosphate regulon sensor histidine kinase PhoR
MSESIADPLPESERKELDYPGDLPSLAPSPDGNLAFYKFVIDSVPLAIVAMNSSFNIIEFNHWAEKVTGYPREEALGRQCRDILQSELCKGECPLKTILNRAKSNVAGRSIIHNREGRSIPVRFNAAALFGAEGKLLGGVEAFTDITNLVAMEREKVNLISMLAHDMRSSLTGIHGLGLRLLRKLADMDRENEKKYLEMITKEASNLETMIDDFLDFSRIETGKLKLNIRATSLDKELEELFDVYLVKAGQRGIKLDLQIENILPVIEADTNRLRRVFSNLLDNAVKFSSRDGKITIAAEEKEHEVMVSITDEGVGIDPDDLPHIFDVFHRGRTTNGTEGHGLGLATVKAIVEGHGGRVVVASAPNTGATFTVFLPKGEAGPDRSRTEHTSFDPDEK